MMEIFELFEIHTMLDQKIEIDLQNRENDLKEFDDVIGVALLIATKDGFFRTFGAIG